jgi:hypothetical protein
VSGKLASTLNQETLMRLAAIVAGLVLSAASGAWGQGPPPPVLTPPELEKTYDGYDLRTPYQLWRYWVENQKGPVIEALTAEPDASPDDPVVGRPLIRFRGSGDMGLVVAGDLRAYCRRKLPYGFDNCRHVMRRVTIPIDAASYGTENPLSTWTRQNFGPERLAARLKAAGFAPDTNWWMADRARMFDGQPSPAEVLRRAAKVERVDTRECAAMAKAIEEMETKRIDGAVDFWTVGSETRLVPPRPHATRWLFTVEMLVGGRPVTLESDGAVVDPIIGPVLDAGETCMRAKTQPGQ